MVTTVGWDCANPINDPHHNAVQSFRVILRPCGLSGGAVPIFHWMMVIAGLQIIVTAGAPGNVSA
jgi:hypothetical protein